MVAPKRDYNAALLLEDGTLFWGRGFGYPTTKVGEVVFTTGMVGYTESITDPSYRGQILTFTYPLIGNYGVPLYSDVDQNNIPLNFESDQAQVSGVVVSELCRAPSHWRSKKSLDSWLYEEGVPGIEGIDSRELTKKLRVQGVMMGVLAVAEDKIDVEDVRRLLASAKKYGEQDFVSVVSVKEPIIYGEGEDKVVLIDCGVKYGIIRELLKRGLKVIRVPYNTSVSEIMEYNPKGVLVSNGPGDPKICVKTVETVKSLVDEGIPMLGICLGLQIIALSLGGDTYKLKYGHRGQNKPCIDLKTGRNYITSQNHGYAVDPNSIDKSGLDIWMINADDKTVEGVYHEAKPILAVQYHPEASPGPYDTTYIFDMFAQRMEVRSHTT
ncbi:MAG: glutamine-hydrolyzing carbamoyl-phosphate synthase small subunit [Nitrososphaerales archaeon]